jgi:hypothetical protein
MTAEVVILNQYAVAMAADSAITISRAGKVKTLPRANKIFTLSKYQPIGVMVYGNATLANLPWETLIKVYREEVGKKVFASVDECAEGLLGFLASCNLIPDEYQRQLFLESVNSIFGLIRSHVELDIMDKEHLTESGYQKLILDIVTYYHRLWLKAARVPLAPKGVNQRVEKDFGSEIRQIAKKTFEEWKLTRTTLQRLVEIACNLPAKWPDWPPVGNEAGVVITGFPGNAVFPSLRSFQVGGILYDTPKYKYDHPKKLEVGVTTQAAIVPFAQREWVFTFIEGVNPNYQKEIKDTIAEIASTLPALVIDSIEPLMAQEKARRKRDFAGQNTDKLIEKLQRSLDSWRKKVFVDPVLAMISSLPKEELATIAESLVNLVSFRQKVTMEQETVGGPVDVALISRGDGFIWIRRKHYFNKDLNPHFFTTYYTRRKESDNKAGKAEK